MPLLSPPFTCSRPALELLDRLGYGKVGITFQKAKEVEGSPRTTVVRHLGELVDHHLMVRLRRDHYATPTKPTYALLLAEPNRYFRSLLLYDDVLRDVVGGLKRSPFACLPVRSALDVEIPQAVPVFKLDMDITGHVEELMTDLALHYNYEDDPVGEMEVAFPSDAADSPTAVRRAFPVLDPRTSLALFAATGDPRIVQGLEDAAVRLGLDASDVLDAALHLHPDEPPVRRLGPNTVVYPAWLQDYARTAGQVYRRQALRSAADALTGGEGDAG